MSFDEQTGFDPNAFLSPQPPRDRRPSSRGDRTGTLVRVLLSLFVIGLAALVIMVTVRNRGGPEIPPTPSFTGAEVTPIIATFTPGPTATPVNVLPVETPTATPQPAPAALAVGVTAEVAAGGSGLNLREGPGLTFQILSLLPDGTRVEVIGGPEEVDGYTWWRVRTLDAGLEGWVAGDFLRPVAP